MRLYYYGESIIVYQLTGLSLYVIASSQCVCTIMVNLSLSIRRLKPSCYSLITMCLYYYGKSIIVYLLAGLSLHVMASSQCVCTIIMIMVNLSLSIRRLKPSCYSLITMCLYYYGKSIIVYLLAGLSLHVMASSQCVCTIIMIMVNLSLSISSPA